MFSIQTLLSIQIILNVKDFFYRRMLKAFITKPSEIKNIWRNLKRNQLYDTNQIYCKHIKEVEIKLEGVVTETVVIVS